MASLLFPICFMEWSNFHEWKIWFEWKHLATLKIFTRSLRAVLKVGLFTQKLSISRIMAFTCWNFPSVVCKHCGHTLSNRSYTFWRVVSVSRPYSVHLFRPRMMLETAPNQSLQEVVIGNGRIGSLLARAPDMKECIVVKRGENIPGEGSGPIYVCTRNDDLNSIVERTPANRRPDLVFIQNGMIQTFLEEKNLQNNTQALVWARFQNNSENN